MRIVRGLLLVVAAVAFGGLAWTGWPFPNDALWRWATFVAGVVGLEFIVLLLYVRAGR